MHIFKKCLSLLWVGVAAAQPHSGPHFSLFSVLCVYNIYYFMFENVWCVRIHSRYRYLVY